MKTMSGVATATSGAVGEPGAVYSANAPSTKQIRPPTNSRPWLVTVNSSTNRTIARPISSRPATLSGRLPKPMNARISAIAPEDAGHEVGALELEDQPVEADRQQDERDVRVGQQVEDRLERVHRQLDERGVGDVDGDRHGTDVHDLAVGLAADVLERGRDAVDRADGDGLRRRRRDRVLDRGDRPVDVPSARLGDRPGCCAIASLRTLSPIVPSSSSPPDPTGEAAPMLVPGAM